MTQSSRTDGGVRLSRRALTRLSLGLGLVAFPVVWALGYQDHPWRQPVLAIIIGLVMLGLAVALGIARGSFDPPPQAWPSVFAITSTAIAAGSAALWWLFNAVGDI